MWIWYCKFGGHFNSISKDKTIGQNIISFSGRKVDNRRFVDLPKAFNTLDYYEIPSAKLRNHGLTGTALVWFWNYRIIILKLSNNRTHYVEWTIVHSIQKSLSQRAYNGALLMPRCCSWSMCSTKCHRDWFKLINICRLHFHVTCSHLVARYSHIHNNTKLSHIMVLITKLVHWPLGNLNDILD